MCDHGVSAHGVIDHNGDVDHHHGAGDHHHHGDSHHTHVEFTAPPRGGALVLDIGGGFGALMVLLDRQWLDYEIHARRVGDSETSRTIHTGVWERLVGGEMVVAGLFCELAEGAYDLLNIDGKPMCRITIESGVVGHADLRNEQSRLIEPIGAR
jgi:hypothetical protein